MIYYIVCPKLIRNERNIFDYLQWIEFCKGLLIEARWYHNRYTPNIEEYLANGWVTSSGPLLSIHVVYSLSHGEQEEANEFLKNNHDLVYNMSMIIRLCNDQGTTKVGFACNKILFTCMRVCVLLYL